MSMSYSIEPCTKFIGCLDCLNLAITDPSYSEPLRSLEPMRLSLSVERHEGDDRINEFRIRSNVDLGEWARTPYGALASYYGRASFGNEVGENNCRWMRESGLPYIMGARFDIAREIEEHFAEADAQDQSDAETDAIMRAEQAAGA